MRIPIFVFSVIIIALALVTYASYKSGYEVGKRSIIINPKGTIQDLIKDFSEINSESAKKKREYWKY